MTIEEKAQKYDEAKLRMSAAYNSNRCTIGFMTEIFPELQENEDEKIRKWLIALIKSNEYGSISNVGEMPCPKLNVLAWLEKQGNLMKALQTSNAEIGELIEKNYYLKEQVEKQGEQKPVFEMKTPEESLGIDSDTYSKIVDECVYGEQKSVWSEKDEKEVAVLEAYIRSKDWSDRHIDRALGIVDELVNKVKSIRPQPKNEWSEEDSYMLEQAIKCVNNSGKLDVSTEEIEYWLKSIRLQKWKPTEEQIKALNIAIRCGINPSTWEGDALRSLLEQLKQL